MAGGTFAASVETWCNQGRGRLEEVFKRSAQYVIEDVIERTPRDTGFLVNSFTVQIGDVLPIDPGARPPEGTPTGAFDAKPYAAVISNASIGSVITGSFVASYAGFVEYGANGRTPVGMVRLSVQRWQEHVDRAVAETKVLVASKSGS